MLHVVASYEDALVKFRVLGQFISTRERTFPFFDISNDFCLRQELDSAGCDAGHAPSYLELHFVS